MDTTQLFLTFVLILSTGLLIAVGVQLFYALREFRKTLQRVNGILDTVEETTHDLKFSLSGVVGIFEGFVSLIKTLEVIHLLTPLHDYLKRKHKSVSTSPKNSTPIPKSSKGIHAIMSKMKDASNKKEKKFIIKTS